MPVGVRVRCACVDMCVCVRCLSFGPNSLHSGFHPRRLGLLMHGFLPLLRMPLTTINYHCDPRKSLQFPQQAPQRYFSVGSRAMFCRTSPCFEKPLLSSGRQNRHVYSQWRPLGPDPNRSRSTRTLDIHHSGRFGAHFQS